MTGTDTSFKTSLRQRLLHWYDKNKRDLPWRRVRDPYAVFVSEMMLQQTQVSTVIPYYRRWMGSFPTWRSLARAPLARVLKRWEGLGYYRRARNLHAAAREVAARYGGRLPSDEASLRSLPGVGPYSCGAIRSIAFGEKHPVVDGNVVRVFSRLFIVEGDPKSPRVVNRVWKAAWDLVPAKRPGDFNQALMELGATVCLKDNPRCGVCPLYSICGARKHGWQDRLPQAAHRAKTVIIHVAAALVERNGRVLIRRRADDSRWLGGLWEFPNEEADDKTKARRLLQDSLGTGLPGKASFGFSHQITHHKIHCRVYRARVSRGARSDPFYRWVDKSGLDKAAMGSAHSKIRTHREERK